MLSPRTAKYVEAMYREGDNFDYGRWLRRVREDEAQARQVPAALSSGDLGLPLKPRRADQYAWSP